MAIVLCNRTYIIATGGAIVAVAVVVVRGTIAICDIGIVACVPWPLV